jgi:osmotically-inducible protein OsmY
MKTGKTLVLAIGLGFGAAVSFTGCSSTGDFTLMTSPKERTPAQYVDDGALTRRINYEFRRNPGYKFEHVKVSAYKNVVQLNGAVEQEEQKKLAEQIAINVAGVLDLVSNLAVDPQLHLAEEGRGSPGRSGQ